MGQSDELLITYYGDDFTGSTDALESLACAGVRTVLFLKPPTLEQLRELPDLQAIGVAGMTRSMAPGAMEAELRPALTALRAIGAPHVHYKVCSTFDSSPTVGSIGRAIDIAADVFSAPLIPLVVGAPALGRYCVFGNLFARMGIGTDGDVYRLDRHPSMSRHPTTPMDESDLRLHLARQTNRRIALFDVLQYERTASEQRAKLNEIVSGKADIVLFDALYADHLTCIGALIDRYASHEQPLFSVGSSAVENALTSHWTKQDRLQPVGRWPEIDAVDRLLVVSGSCSPVTAAQIETAVASGFEEIALEPATFAADVATEESVDAAAAKAICLLKERRSVVVHTSRGPANPRVRANAAKLGAALGQIVRRALEQVAVSRVCFAGGDTSSFAARALGVEALEMIAPFVPGAPLCRAMAPSSPVGGLEVNFKGGQVGGRTYFVDLALGTR